MVKTAVIVCIAVLGSLFAWKGVIPGWREVSTDFANYYVSSRALLAGENLDSLYNSDWFKAKGRQYEAPQAQKFDPFPPITAFAALPFAWLEIQTAQRLSVILDVILLCCCVPLVRRISGWGWLPSILFLLAPGIGLSNNVRLGQIYIAILFLTLLGYILIGKKDQLSGISYALIFVIKYFSLIYLPGFWLARRKQLTFAFIVFAAGLVMFQFIYFGPAVMSEYFLSSLLPHMDGRLSGQGIHNYSFQSWESFLSFLFVEDPHYNPQPFLATPWAKTPVKYFIFLALLGGMMFAIRKALRLAEDQRLNACLGILGISGFALLPVSATYHFVMLAFPVLLICNLSNIDNRYRWAILFLYAGIGLIPYKFFAQLAGDWGVFFGFPRLWAVSILFVITLLAVAGVEHKTSQS